MTNPKKIRTIIGFRQEKIHSSGDIRFGPDGYLYSAQGDRARYAQNMSVLAGKVSRIDINKKEKGKEYAIPKDNPFVDTQRNSPRNLGVRFSGSLPVRL